MHRSDGSGTNFIFTNYLSKKSPAWASKVGAATSVEWPAGIGAKGNEGVAGNVKQTGGALGYVEYAYAKQNNIAFVRMINHDGVAAVADGGSLPGGIREDRLGAFAGFLRRADGSARSRCVADRGRDFHPRLQASGGCGED